MDKNPNDEIRLAEAWGRLEPLCRRLWDEGYPAAVQFQAVIEEFKGEAHRAEQTIATLRRLYEEVRDAVSREKECAYSEEIQALRLQFQSAQERLAGQDADLAKKEERIQALLKELATKEAQNLEFHERFLASSAEQDEARAKKMESFYQELTAKEAALESRWEGRHASLEAEHKERTDVLKGKHEELLAEVRSRAASLEEHYSKRETDLAAAQEHFRAERESWEASRLAESQASSRRKDELTLQAENLAGEYKKKQAELQRIKEAMQSELAEVVRQYQARMRESRA